MLPCLPQFLSFQGERPVDVLLAVPGTELAAKANDALGSNPHQDE